MRVDERNNKLTESLQSFKDNVDELFPRGNTTHVTCDEMHQFAERLNDTLMDFQENITQYLKDHE